MKPKLSYSSITRMLNPEGRLSKLRLDKNEHTYGLPRSLVEEALKGVTPELLASYPEVRPLYAKLAETYGVQEQNLMLASGSDPAIKSLYEMFVSEGDEVVLLSPTYAMFHVYAQMFGAKAVNISYGADLSLDPEQILSAIHPGVSLLAIANPNSPTGTVINQSVLLEIIGSARDAGVVTLIDEAYHPFCPDTVLPHIREFENLAVTRTFSKAFGLANLRLGFMAAHEGLIDLVMKVRPMYEINGVAAHFGRFLLQHMDVVEQYVREVQEGMRYLATEMEALGFQPYPTAANFMVIRIADERARQRIAEHLADNDVLIAGRMAPPLNECIRISLGSPEQMAVVTGHIREALSTMAPR